MNNIHSRNSGTALVTALVLMVALTIVSLSGMQATSMQLQISGNDEAVVEATQVAQSVLDAVIENPANFSVGTTENYTVCAAAGDGCDSISITLSNPMFATSGLQAKVQYLKETTPPRMQKASSAQYTKAAYYKITGGFDQTADNRGRANVVQGYFTLHSSGQQ